MSALYSSVFLSSDEDDAEYRHHLEEELEEYRIKNKRKCPDCGLDCHVSYKMIDHFFACHGRLKKFLCDRDEDCINAYWTREELNHHVQLSHVS